eukprot:11863841-Karenia_brevis.AAC.1
MEPYLSRGHWLFIQCAGYPEGQASDVIMIIRLLANNFLKWPDLSPCVVKLDLKRAFDKVKVSSIIHVLSQTSMPLWLIYAYVRTLWGSSIRPVINGEAVP